MCLIILSNFQAIILYSLYIKKEELLPYFKSCIPVYIFENTPNNDLFIDFHINYISVGGKNAFNNQIINLKKKSMLKNTSNYSSYQKERLKNFSCNITLAFRKLYMYSFLHLLQTDPSKKSKSPYGFRICVRLPSISLHFLQILSFTKYRMAGVYLLVPIPRRGDFR